MEVGNPESPGGPKPEAAGLLKENEAADVISGFPNPKVGLTIQCLMMGDQELGL